MNLQLVNQELFNGITCDVWRNDNHEIFMTTEQLAQCIGYQTRYGITKLVQKNKYLKNREFSVSAKLAHGDGKQYDTRVFTFEGIKEILFLAPKSETARKFREWTRRELSTAISESPHFEKNYHVIFADMLTALVTNGKYKSVRGMRKALGRPNAKLKQMLDSPKELQLLQTYESSITNLLDLGFDRHQIKVFLTKEKVPTDQSKDF
ncbi:prophage ps1 protein 14 [Lactococcus lactis subsp. lactis]|uniref:BRO-N domain-containing protein n=1 Tax=Lactococcus lactis TaxID=1358 RepID=UPI00071C815B|nr:Bro-N domain-containing protein [Lactococcus lactis]KST85624.1 prophage ps1 protein 14 [Lactococcus lactis subsp. lactis]